MARFLLILFGLILLLPGACALIFSMEMLRGIIRSGRNDAEVFAIPLLLLWGLCFAISYGGFAIIRAANKK
jgi:hypothetical protein